MGTKAHWDKVYTAKAADDVSWYQREPTLSLELIELAGVGQNAGIIDVGGGRSPLVAALLDRGFTNLTVLDVSATALDLTKRELGSAAQIVDWIVSDVTRFTPSRTWQLWHDRATFHFLVDVEDRAAYKEALEQALGAGGYALIATFAPEGPEQCSGLSVARYSAEDLARELGTGYELVEYREEAHETPRQVIQQFQYSLLRRR